MKACDIRQKNGYKDLNLQKPKRVYRFQERPVSSARNSAMTLAGELSAGLPALRTMVRATFSFLVRTAVVLVTRASRPERACATTVAAVPREALSLDGVRGSMAASKCC
jgi:hypothetical protein